MSNDNDMALISNVDKKNAKKPVKKLKPKKRTLDEFKNWLEGIQVFGDEEWVPNADQWEYIKDSIYLIKENNQIIEPITQHQSVQPQQVAQYSAPATSNYVAPEIPRPGSSSLGHINFQQPNAIKRDIDTSDGKYISDFE